MWTLLRPYNMALKMTLLWWCFMCIIVMSVTGQNTEFSVRENQPHGTYLGQVPIQSELLDSLDQSQKAELRYRIFAQGNPWPDYFQVDEISGVIITAAPLDRETLCPDGRKECVVDLDIAIYSETFLRIVRVSVSVLDVNDNSPEFPEPEAIVRIPESVLINFTVPISGATDADTGDNNGVQTYEIINSNGQFGISVIKNLDGSSEVGLIVQSKLDRETVSSFQVKIIAKDGGDPVKTGTLTVNVEVLDVNDHTPKFINAPYTVNVTEDLAVNSLVLKVSSTDKDAGENGAISYQLSSRTLSKFPGLFGIDRLTGGVKLLGGLDFEQVKEFRLVIEAFDHGFPRLTSQTLLTISVNDVNDNAPVINFNFLSSTNSAEILESAEIDDFIAHVSVLDLDSGLNADVTCQTDTDSFKIERLYDNEFQIVLNSSLDREISTNVNVSVVCTDQGEQPLSQRRTFLLLVLDVNDNKPEFLNMSHRVIVPESLNVGHELMKVEAVDADSGINGEVTYWLFGENRDYFRIGEVTGILSLNYQLNFEDRSEITVYVKARDGGTPSMESSIAVDVIISDVNDEPPKFKEPSYNFKVSEDSPSGTVVGKVKAVDPDTSFGGKVEYRMEGRSMFGINSNGTIYTIGSIDRESSPEITATVIAQDATLPSQTSSMEVRIQVLDINDNTPVIVFPDNMNNTVVITREQQDPTIPFSGVNAYDLDVEENGELSYHIQNDEAKSVFKISEQNGSIWLLKSTLFSERQTHIVEVLVKDKGTPHLEATSRFFVILEPNVVESESLYANTNVLIVIVVISITTVLSVLIVIGICCVRRSSNQLSKPGMVTYSISPSNTPNTHHLDLTRERTVLEGKDDNIKDDNIKADNKNNLLKSEKFMDNDQTSDFGGSMDDDVFKTKASECLDLSATPINIFSVRHGTDKAAWLHQLRTNEPIPRTSSTNSRNTVHSLSSMSLDTVTSDSGRGGSEQDSREQHITEDYRLHHSPFKSSIGGSDGDYMDMHRTGRSSMPSPNYTKLSPQYESYLLSRGVVPLRDSPHLHPKGHNSVTPRTILKNNRQLMPKNIFEPKEAPGRNMQLTVHAPSTFHGRNSIRVKEVTVLGTPNPLYSVHMLTKSAHAAPPDVGCLKRQGSVSDSEDDRTTTSGSYTVDLQDFTEFEAVGEPVISAEFNV